MNKTSFFLSLPAVAAAAGLAGCTPSGIRGDGVVAPVSRPIPDFSALRADGAYDIRWTSGSPALTIATDRNLDPLITTTVTGDTLVIGRTQENLSPTRGIVIYVSSSSLGRLEVNGSISLAADRVSGPELKVESSGSSHISLNGSVTDLEGAFSGSCSFDAKALSSRNAKLTLSGSCTAEVTATQTLDVSISGSGQVTYGGNPGKVEQRTSGSAIIRAAR